MELFDVIYSECHKLGSGLGFGAFEGGVIYLSIFSIIVFKGYDSIRALFIKKKEEPKEKPLNINVKVIK